MPSACAGVVAVIAVLLTTAAVADVPPKLTVAPLAKAAPVIVTGVPPAAGPDAGATPVTESDATYAKPPLSVAACVSGLVTVTSTVPSACAGVVAVIVPELVTTTFPAAAPPMVTVAPVAKSAPEIVTAVPPLVEPEEGDMPVMEGAGPEYVNPLASAPLCPSGLVTVTATAPDECAGVVAAIVVALATVTLVAATPPKLTLAPAA